MHLIDTNAWKWLVEGKPLRLAARLLAKPDQPLFLLDISFWSELMDLEAPPAYGPKVALIVTQKELEKKGLASLEVCFDFIRR